jgi:hypothetical protein
MDQSDRLGVDFPFGEFLLFYTEFGKTKEVVSSIEFPGTTASGLN